MCEVHQPRTHSRHVRHRVQVYNSYSSSSVDEVILASSNKRDKMGSYAEPPREPSLLVADLFNVKGLVAVVTGGATGMLSKHMKSQFHSSEQASV